MLGGWNLSGISTVQSGAPVTPTNGQNRALDGTGCSGSHHPDIVASNVTAEHSSRAAMITRFFNTSAFQLPALGRYGTSARGLLSGPANVSTDFAVLKDVAVREEMRFQVRAEMFNLFNQVNFANPIAQLANPRFGQITGAGAGRTLQMGLKFLW